MTNTCLFSYQRFENSNHLHFKRIPVLLLLLPLAMATVRCTSGTLCNEEYPCEGEWECLGNQGQPAIEGRCGKRHATPICYGSYCTMICQRGPRTGELSPGTCPKPFIDCTLYSGSEYWLCLSNGIQPGMTACSHSTPSDCNDAVAIEWME